MQSASASVKQVRARTLLLKCAKILLPLTPVRLCRHVRVSRKMKRRACRHQRMEWLAHTVRQLLWAPFVPRRRTPKVSHRQCSNVSSKASKVNRNLLALTKLMHTRTRLLSAQCRHALATTSSAAQRPITIQTTVLILHAPATATKRNRAAVLNKVNNYS
jgi:hypothetical protein